MKLPPKNPALDLATQLPKLFRHNNFGYIEADNQLKPDWLTKTEFPLSSGELVRLFLEETKLIGVGFGKLTKYILIDIDWLSKYHPTHDIDAFRGILNALEKIGLTRYLVIRSSDSGGIHIYLPLPKQVSTFQLAASVRVTLTDAGFDIKNGHLEIFPNTKSFAKTGTGEFSHYKRHRLPLQSNSGSYMLEDDGLNPQPLLDTTEDQLAAFLDQWEIAAAGQDMKLLNRKLPQLYAKYKQRKNRFKYQSCEDKTKKAREWETALNLARAIGWTGYGQTYSLMPKFLAYGVVFLKLVGKELYDWMHKAITTAPGYQQNCRHQHEIEKMIRSWIRTNDRTQYYSPYKSKPDRNQNYPFGDPLLFKKAEPKSNPANKRTADLAIHRIRTAYSRLIDKLTPELKIEDLKEMIREQMKKIFDRACSNSTLTKYKNIWHPKYRNNPNTLSQTQPNDLQDRATADCSDSVAQPVTKSLETQTLAQTESEHPQTPMICAAAQPLPTPQIPEQSLTTVHIPHHNSSVQAESLLSSPIPEQSFITTYTKHYNSPAKHVVTRKPSKFEFLATALAKIISVAIVVVNAGLAAAVVTNEPANAVDIELVSPQIPTTIAPHPDAHSVEVEHQSDESSPPLEDSTDSARSIEIGRKLRRNVHKVGRKTYPALANCQVVSANGLDWVVRNSNGESWNVSQYALASGVWEIECDAANVVVERVRSIVEIARSVRTNLPALPDVLLSEFLQHPELEEIELTIELADKLASARSDLEVRDLTADLTPTAKIELWKVLNEDERIAVRQITARPTRVVAQESTDNSRAEDLSAPTIQHPDTPEEHQPSDVSLPQPNHLTVHPVIGGLVRTVTGAIGVVRYIFNSLS
ncbi:hypothetical protein, partial [Chamaesiphon sp.]|uniref:hypothetical protein n=1 Tax=Chamaesiphon sp. TaxID=2814140 RepID=UPI003593F65D